MATLNALRKATIMQEDGTALLASEATVTSSDATVVAVSKSTATSSGEWRATGIKGGTATLTATRTLDGATASLEVEVLAASPFSISLGAESPA